MGLSTAVDRFFKVSERGSSIGTEIKSGIATFLTMSYILLVNPQILGAAGLPVKAVVTATALSSTLASLLVGLTANLPVGMSPGMGLNAYLVFSQVLGLHVSIEKALAGCLVAAGVVAVLAVIRALSLILRVVPDSIKLATVVGMGLLLTFIGLQSSKIVVKDEETMVTMGNLLGLEPVLAISGLAIIAALHFRNVKGSIIIGIMVTAVAYFAIQRTWPTSFVALPHLQFFPLDFSELFSKEHISPAAWSAVLAYSLVMVFDIGGAMFGLGNLAGLVKDGQVPGAVVTYLAAALGTALGAVTGTTPLIIAAESAVGIKEGGRTGLVAVTVSGCFLLSMFLAPFLQAIPQVATAPVLVLVGAMMMGESIHIDWSSMVTAVPAFLTIVIQPFTFSIANGIYAGLVMSVLLYVLTGSFMDLFRKEEEYDKEPFTEDLETRLLPEADGVANGQPNGHSPHPSQEAAWGVPAAMGAVPIEASSSYRRASLSRTFDGHHSLTGGSHGSYQRGSFTMYINTLGSQPSPGRSFLRSQQGDSEDPEH
eukprot:GHUV01005372.1.p1 GENE.GHUV01005372.1~~GHUV01005372.1.p1  ORF type:complete len:538 (+),score=89.65 GHUV01005372.1:187-1800(+)